ncbi:hypothetical protein AB0J83_07865 [Actinoplanes sp. NPDC049596]
MIRSPSDTATFNGFADDGTLRATAFYRPLTDLDRRDGWPSESLWADLSI